MGTLCPALDSAAARHDQICWWPRWPRVADDEGGARLERVGADVGVSVGVSECESVMDATCSLLSALCSLLGCIRDHQMRARPRSRSRGSPARGSAAACSAGVAARRRISRGGPGKGDERARMGRYLANRFGPKSGDGRRARVCGLRVWESEGSEGSEGFEGFKESEGSEGCEGCEGGEGGVKGVKGV